MPDNIERQIYKLELDDSDYIRGVDRMTSNTQRFSQAQTDANNKLNEAKRILKDYSDAVTYTQKQIEAAGTKSPEVSKELNRRLEIYKQTQADLTDEISKQQTAYENATKAAQTFAQTAATATEQAATPVTTPTGQPIAAVPSAANAPIPEVTDNLKQLADQINNLEPAAFIDLLSQLAPSMDDLRNSATALEEKMKELAEQGKQTGDEYNALANTLAATNTVIQLYDNQVKQTGVSTLSYRTQITQLRQELSILEEQGKAETQEYLEKEQALVKVTRAYNNQRQVIRILSSESRALDFGKAAIQTATSAYQTFAAVQILAGGASEELQKKTFQLFAAMQLITSLEQLHNQLKAVSVIRTNAQSVAQAAYTAVVGASTGALKAFRIALLGTGVGLIIAGIGFLVAKLIELKNAEKEAAEQQKLLNEINEAAIKAFGAEVTHLELIRRELTNLDNPQKQRIQLAKEYNKTAEEGNKIDLQQIDNIALVNAAIDSQIKKIEERARARAAENVLTKREEELFLAQEKARQGVTLAGRINQPANQPQPQIGDIVPVFDAKLGKIRDVKLTAKDIKAFKDAAIRSNKKIEEAQIDKIIAADPDVKKAQDAVNKVLSLGFFNIETLLTVPKETKEVKLPENIFEQEKQKLLDRIQQLRIDEETGIRKINDQFALKFQEEQIRIGKLLKDKKIDLSQAAELINLSATLNKAELDKALKDFNDTIIKSREKLNDELDQLQIKNTQDQLNLIQDEFDKRAALIEFNEQKELDAVKKATQDKLDELAKAAQEAAQASTFGVRVPITETDKKVFQQQLDDQKFYEDEKNKIVEEGEQAETNVRLKAAQDRQKLAFDSFKQTLENADRAISNTKLVSNKAALAEIQELAKSFQTGKTTYEQYKKDLAAIQRKYEDQELQNTIDILDAEIRALQRKALNDLTLTAKEYDDLKALIAQKEGELVAAQTKIATNSVVDTKTKEKKDTVSDYADAIGNLSEAVISFWQKSNEAEQKALDRSIELQDRRVNEARRIAERGNASYLKMEEDRLKQLQVAKENAARRELGINAAIQASQLLVGITGAISEIATGVGTAKAIADIAIIVSSLAAGFALVKSLQANQPKFAKGEKYVRRTKEPAGVDTIPAWLTEGEAVITKEKNKAYHPVIEAIHDGTVPATFLNKQVETYHKIKTPAQPNYERIKNTAEMHITSDGRVAGLISDQNRKIDENNDLQRQTLRAMKNMSVNASIDRDGIAIAVNEYVEKMKIDRFI